MTNLFWCLFFEDVRRPTVFPHLEHYEITQTIQ